LNSLTLSEAIGCRFGVGLDGWEDLSRSDAIEIIKNTELRVGEISREEAFELLAECDAAFATARRIREDVINGTGAAYVRHQAPTFIGGPWTRTQLSIIGSHEPQFHADSARTFLITRELMALDN